MNPTDSAPPTAAGTVPINVAVSLTTAVVLARGLGSRMRAASGGTTLDAAQAAAAASGAKAMMPLGGRPFLDYVLSALADAGITDACLVIGPEHTAVREHYDARRPGRLSIGYAVQDAPNGTADAVAAAESYVAGRRFVVVNGDNFYDPDAVARLASVPGNATLGYDRAALVRLGNIPADRVAAYAILATEGGVLTEIVEKPSADAVAAAGEHALVSMNCWAFTSAIFDACRAIGPSARGEYELADAVLALVASGHSVRVVGVESGVLDLSSRGDVGSVEAALRGRSVML